MPRLSSLRPWRKSHHERNWDREAQCRIRHDLPWISDYRPVPMVEQEMRNICMTCPVLQRCAGEAYFYLNNHGVIGGFYAGVWIPWPNNTETSETRRQRSRARRVVQRRSMTSVTVYTSNNCNYCYSTKKWLDGKNLPYNEINVDLTPGAREALTREGFMSLPVVKTGDGRVWAGFRIDRLKELITT